MLLFYIRFKLSAFQVEGKLAVLMTRIELINACTARNLSAGGAIPELIDRLFVYEWDHNDDAEMEEAEEQETEVQEDTQPVNPPMVTQRTPRQIRDAGRYAIKNAEKASSAASSVGTAEVQFIYAKSFAQ